MKPNEPFVSIIIVTWNNSDDIVNCLKSVFSQTYKNFNVILVDNASTDTTVEKIRANFREIILIQNKTNLYLTKGNNKGIKFAIDNFDSKYIMVLNPDTTVSENLLTELVSVLETNIQVGAVGPKVIFDNKRDKGLINSAGLIFDGFMQAYDRGYMQKDNEQFNKKEYIFGVTGACILYRTEMLNQIGLYWEQVRLHLDEVELFIRAKKRNWKVIYNPKAVVYHKYMQSTDKNKAYKIDKAKKTVWLKIALKHYSIKSKLAMIKRYLFS